MIELRVVQRSGVAVSEALRQRNRSVRARPRAQQPTRVEFGLPVVGNLLALTSDRLWVLEQVARIPSGICETRLLERSAVFVSTPELAHEVLVSQAESFVKGLTYDLLRPMVGCGLLTSEDELHRRQRHLMAPTFAARRIASYADAMSAITERTAEAWADDAEVDVVEQMMRLTLAVVSKTLLDTDTRGDSERVADAVSALVRDVNLRLTLPVPPLRWPTPGNLRARAALRALDEIIYRIIAERRRDGRDHGDLLSTLLQAQEEGGGGGMDDRQLRDEIMTIFLAGHETTATGLAWSFYLLGKHPKIYARLREQAQSVLGGRAPTYADLPKLGYALQVFKEALRMYPPAYAMGRNAREDLVLGGVRVRAGTDVVVNIIGMHHDPRYFPEPQRFDPDRFEPSAEKSLPRGAYLPFGGGSRVCIGNHFALMEGQLVLAALAQRVELAFTRPLELEPQPMVTLRPRGPLPMRVHKLA